MPEQYFQHTFPNGLTLLAEQIPSVQSAAMMLLLAAGSATDPAGEAGSGSVLSDLVLRGAGSHDSRSITEYLDGLGLQRSSSIGLFHTHFSCAALASSVLKSLPVYADIIRRPHLPLDGFEAGRDLSLQSLEALADDPRQMLLVKLREHFLPWPLGRNSMGTPDELRNMSLASCKADWQRRYQPSQAIFTIAGNIEFNSVKDAVEKYFGDMPAGDLPEFSTKLSLGHYHREPQETEQTHIGIAWPSIPETDPSYYLVRIACEVLGGGMSGRLFTEVREKRGLCYSVWAGYMGIKGRGAVMAYAGSSNDKAQETLDCTLGEIRHMSKGITQQELDRAKTGLKANMIMEGESTSARAGAIAHDFFIRGRIRSLDEIKNDLDKITLDQINAYLAAHPPGPFTVVLVGPKDLGLGF